MASYCVFYKTSDKELIKRALRRLPEAVFYCWKSMPKFRIPRNKWYDKKEFRIIMTYNNNTDEKETEHAHEALDLAQAFIEGVLWSKRQSRRVRQ